MDFALTDVVEALRKVSQNKDIVLLSGAFDLLHKGHVTFLNSCKELGDILVVGVQSDERVSKKKGPKRPIVGEQNRAFIVSHLKCVDYTFIIRESLMEGGIDLIKPNKIIFCKEQDKDFSEYEKVIERYNKKYPNIECVVVDRPNAGRAEGNSTTKTVEKILKLYDTQR